jgi:AAA+ superfamily predicted ATPase
MKTIETILRPYREGKSCVIVNGRSLYDLGLNSSNLMQPLVELLRVQALKEHNLIMVNYSKSTGMNYDLSDLNSNERANVTKVLSDLGIKSSGSRGSCDEGEFVNILRGLQKLGQQSTPLTLRDGVPLRFLILIEFSEHLLPHLNNGTHTNEQVLAIELAMRLSSSLGFRKSQNYTVLCEARPGLMESIIYQNMDTITIPQPNADDKISLIGALEQRYPKANVDPTLDNGIVANLCSGTPNRSLESIYLASERTGEQITAQKLFERKQSDIISLSEGTLEAINHNRVAGIELTGRTIERPMQVLDRIANGLRTGSRSTPRNIILAGSPSGGKTVLTLLAAARARVPAYNLVSPKSQWVGESERRTKLMLGLLRELGGMGLIDEIELQMPMDRGQASNDSGVTENLIGQIQSFLADTSLAGRVCLIGTSNRPHKISEAMRQRWLVVPVLMPVETDYPHIVRSIAQSINPGIDLNSNDPRLIEASGRFYRAGAAPREIREAIVASQTILNGEGVSLDNIEFASHDIIPNSNQIASIFSDYVALQYCRSNSFLPWWDEKANAPDAEYPFPDYIRSVLNTDLTINHGALRQQIAELEPYANV